VIDRKSLSNPFNSSIVTSPVQAVPADVPEIHRESFELCRQAYDLVVRERLLTLRAAFRRRGVRQDALAEPVSALVIGEMDRPPFLAPASLIAIRMETARVKSGGTSGSVSRRI